MNPALALNEHQQSVSQTLSPSSYLKPTFLSPCNSQLKTKLILINQTPMFNLNQIQLEHWQSFYVLKYVKGIQILMLMGT